MFMGYIDFCFEVTMTSQKIFLLIPHFFLIDIFNHCVKHNFFFNFSVYAFVVPGFLDIFH